MFFQKQSQKHRDTQIFQQQLYTYRKIDALKQNRLSEDELRKKVLVEHIKWIEVNSFENYGHRKVDRSNLKTSMPLNGRKQSRNSPSKSIASSRMGYRRGHQVQRTYYQSLINQLTDLQQSTPHLTKMNSSQILEYQSKYLEEYLSIFLKQTESQCFQKSAFLKKLYQVIRKIMFQLLERLYQELFNNQQYYLQSTLSTHKQYQQKIDNLNSVINEKNEKIKLFQKHIEIILKKNSQKKKKNKNLSVNLIKAAQRIIQVEQQKNCLENQYINMLTIGFEGGMTYEEACVHVAEKINRSLISNSIKVSLKNKIYELKQFFSPKNSNANLSSKKKNNPNQMAPKIQQEKKIQQKNQRIQVNIYSKDLVSYGCNFRPSQKYKQDLIRNIQIQTQDMDHKLVINQAVQWCSQDFKYIKSNSISKEESQILISVSDKQAMIIQKMQTKITNQLQQISNVCGNNSRKDENEQFEKAEEEINKITQSKESIIKKGRIPERRSRQNIIMKKKPKKKSQIGSSNFRADQRKKKQIGNIILNSFSNKSNNKKGTGIQQMSSELSDDLKKSLQQKLQKQYAHQQQLSVSSKSFVSSEPESEKQEDYQKTDLFSVIQNMHNVSPNGIYIDETMLFLLKKSLFRVKHESAALDARQVYKKNSKYMSQVRCSIGDINKQRKKTMTLISLKNVTKLISTVYENAYLILYPEEKKEVSNRTVINLLDLLKEAICKEYPSYKITSPDLQNKLAVLFQSMQCYSVTNYLVKNFLLLSCLDDNIYSPIIFTSDITFYLGLLGQLNVNRPPTRNKTGHKSSNSGNLLTSSPGDSNGQFSKKSASFLGSFETCYTTVSKLSTILGEYIPKYFKKKELIDYISKKVNEILSGYSQISIGEETRLDIYKCSQLIMQALFSFKISVLKSYSKLAYIPDITVKSLITEELLIDLLGFMQLSKLDSLNIINRFRYCYGKKAAISGISLITFVNFCLVNNFPDFDAIIVGVNKYSNLPPNISLKDIQRHPKIDKVQKIALYFHDQERKTGKQTFISAAKLVHAKLIQMQSTQLLQKILGTHLVSLYVTSLCQLQEKKAQVEENI